jgi:hypothetical protein
MIVSARRDLSAQSAARIVLNSAADRNERGVDRTSGRGLVDLAKALKRSTELQSQSTTASAG